MKLNLFLNVYIDKVDIRQRELEYCFQKNVDNPYIDHIYAFVSEEHEGYWRKRFPKPNKVTFLMANFRPTFSYYFSCMHDFPKDLNCISNTDIYFDETIGIAKNFDWVKYPNHCFALTRYDLRPASEYQGIKYAERIEYYRHADSQDVWLMFGKPKPLGYDSFPLGWRGCDNRIAHELRAAGYNVLNPSLNIRCIHVHNSEVRNYSCVANEDLVPPPYLLVQPCNLENVT